MFCKAKNKKHGQVAKRARRRRSRLARLVFGAGALIVAAALTPVPASPATPQNRRAVHWLFTWDGAVIASRGGVAPGGSYDNLVRASLAADGPALGLSATLHLDATFACTQNGRSISEDVGDAQGVINLDADSRCRPYTLSAARDLGGGVIARLGLIPADQYFDTADSAATLLNSSFGVEPTWSHNTVAPIFPTAGLGAMIAWRHGAWLDHAAVFQAAPNNLSSILHRGALFIDELVYDASDSGIGTYKLGLWSYHPHGSKTADLPPANLGLYFIAERSFTSANPTGATAFFRLGWSPKEVSAVPLDIQAGVCIPDPLAAAHFGDQLTLGVAVAQLRGHRIETAFEITYVLSVSDHVSLQPDLQYVVHPGGIHASATVAAMRLHMEFD